MRKQIAASPLEALRRFDYIGEVTVYHLAKNLGVDVAKPDRHLVRLANAHGYSNPHHFCAAVSAATGLRVHAVDSILWRIAEIGLADDIFMPDVALRSAAQNIPC